MKTRSINLDANDFKAISYLMDNGRAGWTEMASVLGLSAPAVADRVRRMEEAGVIRGYAALIEPAELGMDLTAFISVVLRGPGDRESFLARVAAMPEVQECHHVAGDFDYFLKVRCAGSRELEQIIVDRLKGPGGVSRTRTTIVLSTYKETASLPLQTDA
jgi:Lrp/AsnC family leucine-responsive transcriptional regulator